MSRKTEWQKDLRTAADLEQQLLISYAQKGVAVLDVYSSEWGACKAINEIFYRLHMEAADGVHLRFYTVECNAVLESLKNPQDINRNQRPKNTEAIKDALPEGWEPILKAQRGRSQPLFVFYKEGKIVGRVNGVDSPSLQALVKDLCTVKTPASEFITNIKLQEFWDDQFNPEESEVSFDKFVRGLQAHCGLKVNLNDDEKRAVLEALGIAKESKDRVVTADALQKWIGDDETNTVPVALKAVIPEYDERAAQVIAEREEEEARRKEEEEAARREAEQREAEEKRQREEAERNERARRVQELNSAIAAKLELIECSAEADAVAEADGEADAEEAAKNPVNAETSTTDIPANADAATHSVDSVATMWSFLNGKGAALRTTSRARAACETAAAFALRLLTASTDQVKAMTGIAEADFRSQWATATADLSPLLAAALDARVEPEGELFVKAGAGEVVLGPLTPLHTSGGDGLVPVSGLTAVLPLGKNSANANDTFVALPWFAKFTVAESATFVAFEDLDVFEGKVAEAAEAAQKDDEKLLALVAVRADIKERDSLEPKEEEAAPAAADEEKKDDAAPAAAADDGAKKDDDDKKDDAAPAAAEEEKKDDAAPAADDAKKDDEAPAAADDKKDEEKKDDAAPAAAEEKDDDAPAPASDDKKDDDKKDDAAPAAAEEDKKDDAAPAAADAPASDEKKDDEVKKDDAAPAAAEEEKKDDAPAAASDDKKDDDKKDDAAPAAAEEEKKDAAPAADDAKKDDEAPAASDDKKDEEKKDDAAPAAAES